MDLGFHQTPQDPCLYVHTIENHIVFMAVFVDDILLASRSGSVLATVKAAFQDRFTMTDEGLAQEFLGSHIPRHWHGHSRSATLLRDHRPRLQELYWPKKLFRGTHAGER